MNKRYKKIIILNLVGFVISVALGSYIIATLNLIAALAVYVINKIEAGDE